MTPPKTVTDQTAPTSFSFQPIGVVESPYKEKFGTPRQPGLVAESRGAIVLRDDLNVDAFEGLADYSHVWVVFVFHENQSVREGRPTVKTKVHPPRLEGKAVGVFATRSPHRPNPIGLSLLEIEKVDGRRLWVRGLDLIDGTPVLDLKPYLPSVEALPHAHEGWSAAVASKSVVVEWNPEALRDLETAFGGGITPKGGIGHRDGSDPIETARLAIEKILELDIRPVAYRGTSENPDPYTSRYGFRYGDWNVVFRMLPQINEGVSVTSPQRGVSVTDATAPNPPKRARIERIEAWATRLK